MKQYKSSPYYKGNLSEYVFVNPRTDCSNLLDNENVTFIPMPAVGEKNNCVEYELKEYKEVKKGFTVFKRGDLLWAKITPCMQNGKSCIVDNIPTEIGFGSTEFHVIRPKTNQIYMPYLWAILSNDAILKAAQGVFGGSAGQQRVPSSFLERFPAVIPEYDDQVNMSKHLEDKLNQLNDKLQKADRILFEMDKFVSNVIKVTNDTEENKLTFAIRYSELDGVIDVKRYAAQKNKTHNLTVSDVCDIVDVKFSAKSYRDRIIDWIRIDDLPNNPWDIGKVRTQSAIEVEGSFFQVQKDDILVARLGPTIQNKKIVMVRELERETIASAEFLVLRCKKGYNPEAIMWILKTTYYKDLMYAHARGSTPSRYRLNREDMLTLPFPYISEETQIIIADEAVKSRNLAKELKFDAEQEWADVRKQFEDALLEG